MRGRRGSAPAQSCLASCAADDEACRLACFESDADLPENAAWEGLDACRRAHCIDACIAPEGLAKLLADTPECRACVAGCGYEIRDCLASQTCEYGGACVSECRDPSCSAECSESFPGLDPLLFPAFLCMKGCAAACDFASDFDCVGNYTWYGEQQQDGASISMVVAHVGDVPLAGARAHFCTNSQCSIGTCLEQSFEGAVSGEDGVILLPVPHGSIGCIAIEREGMAPTLFYPGRPITSRIVVPHAINLIERGMEDELAGTFGATQSASLGALILRQFDCRSSVGVVFHPTSSEAGEEVNWVYADESGAFAPNGAGNQAIAFNHALGATTVSSRVDGYDAEVSRVTVHILEGTATWVHLWPTAL
jgi:hypothetical protein